MTFKFVDNNAGVYQFLVESKVIGESGGIVVNVKWLVHLTATPNGDITADMDILEIRCH